MFQFQANRDISATNVTLHSTNAHFIRIHPVNYTGQFACMRLALYGCDKGGTVAYLYIIILWLQPVGGKGVLQEFFLFSLPSL